jgi:hypothetical protein
MAMNTVNYFMWGYQTHFCFNAEIEARRLLSRLDTRFHHCEPKVYLVGRQIDPQKGFHPICTVPDESPYQPETFAGLDALAAEYQAADPENNVFHSLDVAHENAQRAIRMRALVGAVMRKIQAVTDNDEVLTRISWPTKVDNYLVMMVLQLSRPIFDSHNSLTRDFIQERTTVTYHRAPSLLSAVIDEFMQACATFLHRPNPGAGFRIIEEDEELLRRAAKELMYGPAWSGGNHHGLHGLFEACNAISTLKYEGKEGVGRLVIARPEHKALRVDLQLLSPVPLRDYGAVRKLLQLATGDQCLLCDSAEIYGIGAVLDTYDPNDENLFVIRFTKNFMWDLSHAGKPLMYMRYGEPQARVAGFPSGLFMRDLPRIFKGITTEQSERLCTLARALAAQSHGAMLVVSSDAAGEAARLANQATCLRPVPLTEALISRSTLIDGAVLVDLDGICHAIGVILDGRAHRHCTPSRGARYNSAIRYAYGRSDCMVVVKSEDGMVNLFPALRAQISRAELNAQLDRLRAQESARGADGTELNQVMHWLSDHRFYLSADQCVEVHRIYEEAGKHLSSEAWRIGYDQFEPDEEMNDSYFLPDEA